MGTKSTNWRQMSCATNPVSLHIAWDNWLTTQLVSRRGQNWTCYFGMYMLELRCYVILGILWIVSVECLFRKIYNRPRQIFGLNWDEKLEFSLEKCQFELSYGKMNACCFLERYKCSFGHKKDQQGFSEGQQQLVSSSRKIISFLKFLTSSQLKNPNRSSCVSLYL